MQQPHPDVKEKLCFASDNYAGVHPAVLEKLAWANQIKNQPAYGADWFTEQMMKHFYRELGDDCGVYPVFNGTGANILALRSALQSFQSIFCSDVAHLHEDECGAPEKHIGSKLVIVPTRDGKLTVPALEDSLQRIGDQHHTQAKMISISQPTELGTVYSIEEIRALSLFAKKHELYFHMDGARIANAAVSLNVRFKEFTKDAGVDLLSFGGTKNGLMGAEAVVVFRQELLESLPYLRKQLMQLSSKMRFVSAQFLAFFENDLWKKCASHSNEMAEKLADRVSSIEGVQVIYSVDANAVFAEIPESMVEKLQKNVWF